MLQTHIATNLNPSQPLPPANAASSGRTPVVVEPSAEQEAAQLKHAVNEANRIARSTERGIEFSIDHESGRNIVRITDSSTGELIRQLPSKEMIEVANTLGRLQGFLIRQKA